MYTSSLVQPYFSVPSVGQRVWWHLRDHLVPHARNHYQPHALHHRALAAFSVLLLTIKVVSFSAMEMLPPDSALASAITATTVLELTNQSRASVNLPALGYSQVLQRAAQMKADDMLARQYFAHNTPDGKTPWTFFDAVGYAYTTAGENLAVHFSDVEPLQGAWMSSPGHRANILNASFLEMGVGISRGQFEGHDTIFVVEEFGAPAGVTKPIAERPVSPPVAVAQLSFTASPKLVQPKLAQAAKEAANASLASLAQLAITNTSISTTQDAIVVTASASNSAAKLLLVQGERSSMFTSLGNGTWTAQLPVSSADSANLVVKAFDLAGHEAVASVGAVNPSFEAQYQRAGAGDTAGMVKIFGKKVAVKALEHKAYSGIIAFLLTAMVVAFAVHRHLYHVRLIANASFVTLFATFMLLF